MREDYALRYLGRIVDWDESKLSTEAGWLRRISAYKYDSYQDFYGGERFISALIRWLVQFDKEDRDFAYELLRDKLIFLSAPEINHLVQRTVPAYFRNLWIQRIARENKIDPCQIWSSPPNVESYKNIIKRSLFIGLSDGARMDVFRRSNVGVIRNDQITIGYELSETKLDAMVDDLRKNTNDQNAKFEMVFLIDDFLASGTTLCRQNNSNEWTGKIKKFGKIVKNKYQECFVDSLEIITHHYIATDYGLGRARNNLRSLSKDNTNPVLSGRDFLLTADLILKDNTRYPRKTWPQLDAFLDKYYDPKIMSKSLNVGGCPAQNGFADCGLTLVLEHNTPNNSLAILWAQSEEDFDNHSMRPLFRRRQRHD